MTKLISTALFLLCSFSSIAQANLRPVKELISEYDSDWPIIQKWIDSAKNDVDVLKPDSTKAATAIYQMQLTTHNAPGAIVYFTGGILIDHGWIKILGSGNKKLNRSLPEWNKGKTMGAFGDSASFVLIADDAAGGFFAMNAGRFGKENIGKIYYLSPDRLEWESLDLSYSEFLLFCFNGDLDSFYGSMRWPGWEKNLVKLHDGKVFNFNPPLWSKEGKDMSKNKRKPIDIEEQYQFNMQARKELNLEK